MPIERVLITVKTYPTLSKTYGETVCTAGLTQDGKWIRIYPIPFRRIEDLEQRYHKYEWIECDLVQNSAKDKRPESRRPADLKSLKNLARTWVHTMDGWHDVLLSLKKARFSPTCRNLSPMQKPINDS